VVIRSEVRVDRNDLWLVLLRRRPGARGPFICTTSGGGATRLGSKPVCCPCNKGPARSATSGTLDLKGDIDSNAAAHSLLKEHLPGNSPPSTLQLEATPTKAGGIVRRGTTAIFNTDSVRVDSATVFIGTIQENLSIANDEVAVQFVASAKFDLNVGVIDQVQAEEDVLIEYSGDRTGQTLGVISFKVAIANSPPKLNLFPYIGARGRLNLSSIDGRGVITDGLPRFILSGHSLEFFLLLGFQTFTDHTVSLLEAPELLSFFRNSSLLRSFGGLRMNEYE